MVLKFTAIKMREGLLTKTDYDNIRDNGRYNGQGNS